MNKLITFCFTLLLTVLLVSSHSFAQVSYTISTVAGDGSNGFKGDGGLATNAGFDLSVGTAIDAAGNIYVTDEKRIRKIDAVTGIITTIAGNGTSGSSGDGGDASLATLTPLDIKVDALGNIYVVDEVAHRVRKINAATNTITTIAGTGIAGFSGDGGLATSAQLNAPIAIALDNNGNLYISDSGNHRIRKVDATSGLITTIAGNGTLGSLGDDGDATQAQLDVVVGLAADASGSVYLTSFDNKIRRIDTTTGIITLVAGTGVAGFSGDGGNALQAQLNLPWGIMIGNFGDLYVADQGNFRIRKINLCDHTITTVAGNGNVPFNGDDIAATQAQIFPWTLAKDNQGNIYFNETNRIRKLSPSSTSGYFRAGHALAVAGTTIKIPIKSQDLADLVGFQFSLKYDHTKIKLKDVTNINAKLLEFDSTYYNLEATPGEFRAIWTEPLLQQVSWQANELLFNIEIEILSTVALNDKIPLDFAEIIIAETATSFSDSGGLAGCISVVAASKITGTMKTASNQTVNGVELMINQANGSTVILNTSSDGAYHVDNLTPGTYTVTPTKQSAEQNGVDIGDVIAINRHILGKAALSTPYQVIAGDLDMSGQINLLDLLTSRRIVLGHPNVLAKNWRFIPADYTFNNPSNPLSESFPESITTQLTGNQINQDFVAIKIGDVNGNVDPSLRIAAQPLVLATPTQQVFAKQEIQVPIISTTNYHRIAGLQGTLEFNASVLKYKGITSAGLDLDAAKHFNLNKIKQGQLIFVYDHPQGEAESLPNGTVLFYITFEAIGALDQTSTLRFSNQLTPSKAYQEDLTPQSLELNAGEIKIVAPQVNIFPNPAKRFQVTFGITQDKSKVSFSLRNQQGQLVDRQQKMYDQGQQQFTWQPNVAPGIYFLTIETHQYKVTRKLVIQ